VSSETFSTQVENIPIFVGNKTTELRRQLRIGACVVEGFVARVRQSAGGRLDVDSRRVDQERWDWIRQGI
jgi:hypothetical protein